MRDIKFRAWHKKEKRMIYGIEHGRDSRDMSFGDYLDYPDYYEVMQFTGLLDDKGREIYEGDILKELTNNDSSFELGVCKEVIGGWKIFNAKNSSICWHGWKQEVIGNIYENPGMVKEN